MIQTRNIACFSRITNKHSAWEEMAILARRMFAISFSSKESVSIKRRFLFHFSSFLPLLFTKFPLRNNFRKRNWAILSKTPNSIWLGKAWMEAFVIIQCLNLMLHSSCENVKLIWLVLHIVLLLQQCFELTLFIGLMFSLTSLMRCSLYSFSRCSF